MPDRRRPLAAAVVGLAAVAVGLLVLLPHLGALPLAADETGYRDAGLAYLHGDFHANREHPFTVKYLFGLAALVGGPGPVPVRLVSVAAALATAAVLAAFGRQVAGPTAGATAALLWLALPHPVQNGVDVASIAPKVERFALLEPVLVLATTLALWLGWRWLRDGRRRDAAWAGLASGAALSAKATGVLVLPVLVLPGLVLAARGGRRRRTGLLVLLAAAGLVVLASYLPDARHAVGDVAAVLHNGAAQRQSGHAVLLRGVRYPTAPWWALVYWQVAGQGLAVTASLVVLVAAAVVGARTLPRGLVAYLLLAVAVPFAWLSFAVGFELSHYLLTYQAPLDLLAALGLVRLLGGGRAGRALGVLAVVPVVATAALMVAAVLRPPTTGVWSSPSRVTVERIPVVPGW